MEQKYQEIKVKKYKYEKILQEELPFKIPLEPVYWFEYGIRQSFRIVPEWTTWNREHKDKDEEIYRLSITIIDQGIQYALIKNFSINISEIEGIIMKGQGEVHDILEWMNTMQPRNVRTKEEFDSDMESALKTINNGTE